MFFYFNGQEITGMKNATNIQRPIGLEKHKKTSLSEIIFIKTLI